MKDRINNVRDLLNVTAERYADRSAFVYWKKKEQIEITFPEFREQVLGLGTWMYEQGIRGKKVAIYGENSYFWILTHFAATCGFNTAVPVDKELETDRIAFLIDDSEPDVFVYSNGYRDIAEELMPKYGERMKFINMKDLPEAVEEGKALIASGNEEYIKDIPESDGLASILYTSGTTGRPKGVMLSQKNLMSQLAFFDTLKLDFDRGNTLLLLPLHHAFGLSASVYGVLYLGLTNYMNRSLRKIREDISVCKPIILLGVPMICKFLWDALMKGVAEQGKTKEFQKGVKMSNFLRKFGIDRRRKFFKDILDALGGEIRVFVAGGAPIDQELIDKFDSIGICVLNGYGISECSPVVSVNSMAGPVKNSVGKVLSINEVKISDDGEILVKGDNVMQGYYHLEEENKKAFVDGWFRTGDLGRLDDKGNLFITGRIKNLIILENGENIPAEPLEELVLRIPFVKEAIVYGEDGKITAEIYLDPDDADAPGKIQAEIDAINGKLPPSRTIVNVKLRDEEFPKTTTKKIIRSKVIK